MLVTSYKIASFVGETRRHLIYGSLSRMSHFDRFSRFCTTHPCPTDKHTDHATCDIYYYCILLLL